MGLYVFAGDQAQSSVKVEALLHTLLQVQDKIANGDAEAIPLKSHLNKLIGAGLSEIKSDKVMSDAEIRTLLTFSVIGPQSLPLKEALAQLARDPKWKDTARALSFYRNRNGKEALKLLNQVNISDMDARLAPFLYFARGNLNSRVNPEKAINDYNQVRLAAPGTLLDEAVLRRQLVLFVNGRQSEGFLNSSKEYSRRFIKSPYREQFVFALRSGILRLNRLMSHQDIKSIAMAMPDNYATAFLLKLGLDAVVAGQFELASFTIGEAIQSIKKETQSPTGQEKLKLLELLTKITSPDLDAVYRGLQKLDPARLSSEERKLRQLALGVVQSILDPLGYVEDKKALQKSAAETSEVKIAKKSSLPEVSVKPNDTDTSSATANDSNLTKDPAAELLGDFMDNTHMRLKEIDKMLEKP